MSKYRSFLRIFRFLSPKSLRLQLLVRTFFILSILLVLVGIFQYFFMQSFLYTNTARTMQSQIRSIPFQVWQKFGDDNFMGTDPGLLLPLHAPNYTVAIVDIYGNVHELFEDFDHNPAPKLPSTSYQQALDSSQQKRQQQGKAPQQPRDTLTYQIFKDQNGVNQLVVLQPLFQQGTFVGFVQVSSAVNRLQDILNRELLIYASLACVALLAGLFVYRPTIRRTLEPLSSMVDSVEQINAGNLDERLSNEEGQIEIQRLSLAFNAMLERLESSFAAEKEAQEQMRQFIADASHELRTPLTSIHGFLEILLRGAANNKDQLKKALESMLSESERLNKLVNDLLTLTKIDQTPEFQLAEERLDQILRDMEPQLRLLAGERTVEFRLAEQTSVNIDRDKIKQVILNVFQNAIQYTDPIYGTIQVSLAHTADGVVLSIKDNGAGIPKDHVTHVFDRFYRADTSRARKYGGAGLGLAITHSIVQMHAGRITVESREGAGTTFHIWLPAHS